MPARDRARDRGLRQATILRARLGVDIRDARLSAGLGQRHVADVTGLSQAKISRTERNLRPSATLDEFGVLCSVLGLRLHVRAYPDGSPVRDVAQLRLLERLRAQVSHAFTWRSEVPLGIRGDLRAWDVVLEAPARIGIDAETRLHDVQALQRRLELKWRDSELPIVLLVVARTRHNARVLREHRASLASTLPLDSAEVLASLRSGTVPAANGIVVL